MNALVVGGTGMIGPGVVAALADAGHGVTVLHRGLTAAALPTSVRMVHGDRADTAFLKRVLDEHAIDAVVDLACYGPEDVPSLVHAVGERRRLVVVSTVLVYGGPHDGTLDERRPPTPRSAYARRKLDAETALREQAAAGRQATVIRLGACFREGCYLDGQLFESSSWLRRLAAGEPVALADGGRARWSVMHVDDAGRAMAALLENPAAAGRTVLVGSTRTRTWREMYETIAAYLGVRLECVDLEGEWLCARISDPTFLLEMSRWDQEYELSLFRTLVPGFAETTNLDAALCRTASAILASGDFGDEALAAEEGRLIEEWRSAARVHGT